MQIKLKFAELHSPLFLAGTNLQLKLDPTKRTGLELVYDRDEKELLVTWNKAVAIVPISNVSSMTPDDREEPKPKPQAAAPAGLPKPQAATPQDHVFAGPGGGKVRL